MQNNYYTRHLFLMVFLLLQMLGSAQTSVQGYVFETNNRGFLEKALINVYKMPGKTLKTTVETDAYGHFSLALQPGKYRFSTHKDMFEERQDTVIVSENTIFLKMKMQRLPGYLLDVALLDPKGSLRGATVEIYNRTREENMLALVNHPDTFFQYKLERGNHYLVLIRKPGYHDRKMNVKVYLDSCILCIDSLEQSKQVLRATRTLQTKVLLQPTHRPVYASEQKRWSTIEQIIAEEAAAERTREEAKKAQKPERPANLRMRNKKLPEANNTEPLPKFKGGNKNK